MKTSNYFWTLSPVKKKYELCFEEWQEDNVHYKHGGTEEFLGALVKYGKRWNKCAFWAEEEIPSWALNSFEFNEIEGWSLYRKRNKL